MTDSDFKDLPKRTAANKCYVIKHLILLKIQNMTDINADLLQWFTNFLMKNFKYKKGTGINSSIVSENKCPSDFYRKYLGC